MKTFLKGSIAAAMAMASFAVHAEPYKDYTPRKGVWEIQQVEVDPNHIDDYLTGIRKSLITGYEISKKRGLIDDYWVMSRIGYSRDRANIIFGVHYPRIGTLEPDMARDKALDAELYAAFSKEMGEKAVKGYELYRKFLDDGFYTQVDFAK